MTFAELQSIVEPYGFVVRKNFYNWKSKSKKPPEPQAYMASVSLEKSEFPTWIDGISMSVEFVNDEMIYFTVYTKVHKNEDNEFYFDGHGKMITDASKINKEFIEECMLKTLESYNTLRMNIKLQEIEYDFI